MYAIEVTRHAGSAHGHHFEHAVALVRQEGKILTFHAEEAAEHIANHYAKVHQSSEHSICGRTFRVVPYQEEV